MTDFRALKQKHDEAVATMSETAKAQVVEGLSEARKNELQETFDRAYEVHKDCEQRLANFLKLAEIEKSQANEFFEKQERAAGEQGRKPNTDAKDEQMEVFKRSMRVGYERLTQEEKAIANRMFVHQIETRGTSTQIAGTAGLGGYMVPVELQTEMIGLMKDYSGILQAGRIRTTDSGNQITFPSRDFTGRAAVKTAESGAIAVQDITYTQKVMDAYKYTDALKVSWELLQDSAFDIIQEFREAFGESFGRTMNNTLTLGDGSGDPNGVVTASTLGVTAASATAITLAEIIGLEHSVDPAYRRSNSCGYMMHDQLLKTIKTLSLAATNDFAGTWQPSFRDGTPSLINGYRYWLNQDMDSTIDAASKLILFGDFNKYNIRIVRDMVIMRNDYSHMPNGEVGFYAFARWDGELFDTTAVKHLITAAS